MFDIDEHDYSHLDRVIELLEKANAGLEPELLDSAGARELLERYARARKLADFGVAAIARKIDDAQVVSRTTGTPVGQAKATIELGNNLKAAPELGDALQTGAVSAEQAREIACAEASVPGVVEHLVKLASEEPFHVFKDAARKLKLEAEQHNGLAAKQRSSRCARHYSDELGMTHIHLALEPLAATPIVNRAEADAERLYKAAKKETGRTEAFETYLADAFLAMLQGTGKGRASRPELVVLVDYETIKAGWKLTAEGVCKIPGVGPVDPLDAKSLAEDAFVNAVVLDGKDLRHFKRFGRHVPSEIKVALELGTAPAFDGPACVDCGNRFRPERDHLEPVAAQGPTSYTNLDWRCDPCHERKTEADRRAGKLPRHTRPVARSPDADLVVAGAPTTCAPRPRSRGPNLEGAVAGAADT